MKLRGYRVELGEIEAVLRTVPAVHDAVVLVREQRLCAFHTGAPVDGDDLRAAISDRLPGYMLPDETNWLDTMPLNPNGKIDHGALLARKGANLCGS